MDTTTVRLIMATVEEGSISRAANRLDLAIAAASRRISDLEDQLGIKLFRRLPHGVEVTESGGKLIDHIQQIDNLVDRLTGDAQVLVGGLDGRIIIGAPKAVIIEFLCADIARIQQLYPRITLKIVEENSRNIQQSLRDRLIDIGIYESRSGFLDMTPYPYRSDRLVLVYNAAHFSFDTMPVPLDALFDKPLISLGKGSATLAAVERAFRNQGRAFTNNFLVSGFDTMLTMVRNGLGVGLMPPAVLRLLGGETSVSAAELEGSWQQRNYVLSFVEGHVQAQTLANIVAELKQNANARS
ncbi:LysR family transcriptional regulator [Pseudoxanthomonas sp.]|uniref:LysR family transcriptional regulator n=1 Tax=Pseudoxanthomonas sp. TaxID=1871049 RepID=UPI002637F093|nr:LysR family transcriptional regulator [Pseudoxanthomonas sp.]WDS38125.1 MAG: LysR family transcriptional regulator [Pseudoxanthomonas sp.]